MTDNIPTRKLSRATIAGATALKIGANELGNAAKHLLSPSRPSRDDIDAVNAKTLFDALSRLRGTALKIAQLLGMEQGLLPPAYQKELEKSFFEVTPLNRVVVKKALDQAYGTSPLPFEEFDDCSFAAASLGQVHRAKLPNGKPVAVKIQYPGIDTTIENDIKLSRSMLSALPNHRVIFDVLDEIEQRLKEELDYLNEAENARHFKQTVAIDGVNILTTLPLLSRKKVLVAEYVEGLHLHDWLATKPPQPIKNKAAQNLYDFFMASQLKAKRLHADPNPGNFMFHEDGSLTVIDFGCCQPTSTDFVEKIRRLHQAYLQGDAKPIFQAYHDMGIRFPEENKAFYHQVLKPFGDWIILPFREESFNFQDHPRYVQAGMSASQALANEFRKLDGLPETFPFFIRTQHGILQILSALQSDVRMRHWWN